MKFRKKPVVIEAVRLPGIGEEADDFMAWAGEVGLLPHMYSERDECLAIETLEGTMIAQPGDWIIRGVKGEFYPCKPDIFAATYEPADAPAAQPPLELDRASIRTGCETEANREADRKLRELGYTFDARQQQWVKADAPAAQEGCETCQHSGHVNRRGDRLIATIVYNHKAKTDRVDPPRLFCALHDRACKELGNTCGRWAPKVAQPEAQPERETK